MKASEFLTKARDLIEAGWTKQYYARDSYGSDIDYQSAYACQFCAIGALRRVRYDVTDYPAYRNAEQCLREVVGMEITTWNDTASDKAIVISGFSQAIKLAKEREAQ